MAKDVFFYSSVHSKKMFSIQSYYRNDILILKKMGFKVHLSNSILDFFCFWKYDISFLYFYRYSFFAALISKIFCKRIYFTGGIDYLDKNFSSQKQRLVQQLFFILCNILADECIIVSTTDEDNIKTIYGGSLPRNCKLCFHIIDVDKLKFIGDYSSKKNQFATISWMVNLDNVFRKGIDISINIFSAYVKLHPDFKFYIAGSPGKGSDYVEHLIHELSLENSVLYLGEISEEEKSIILKDSMFYFQLSKYEGFGIAALEALVSGCMVIHSGEGGLKNALGIYGYKVDINNEFEILTLLEKLIKQPFDTSFLNAGIEYACKFFSFNKRLEIFKTIIKQ